VLTDIVNASLTESTVPQSFRQAIVRPLLKKPDLDREVFKNYRPGKSIAFELNVCTKKITFITGKPCRRTKIIPNRFDFIYEKCVEFV
jgi:hypothetical protein